MKTFFNKKRRFVPYVTYIKKTDMSWYISVSYLGTIQEWPLENQNRIDLKHVDLSLVRSSELVDSLSLEVNSNGV